MTTHEAKQILLLYRPQAAATAEPELAEALQLAESDPALKRWLEEHCALQQALQEKLRSLPAPEQLRDQILAERKVVRPPFRRVWFTGLAAAAAALLLLFVLRQSQPRVPDAFADYRDRMVRTALRDYRMDIRTNDMAQVREFMAERGAPSDYNLTEGLARLRLTGGGLLSWRENPVSMICFDRGDSRMLFLFVMNRSAVEDPPPQIPQTTRVSKMQTVSWTQGNKTYVLAGPDESGFERKYLNRPGQ